MAITEALPRVRSAANAEAASAPSPAPTAEPATVASPAPALAPSPAQIPTPAPEQPAYRPVPIWFFAFEGLFGASYDVFKSSPHAWIVLAVAGATNLVLARTVLRGRLRMVKAMLRGRRTRKLAVGLIALRVGVHFALGAIGMEATSGPAHLAFAALMCVTTVALLAFDQKVMLRALTTGEQARDGRA